MAKYPPYTNPLEFLKTGIAGIDPNADDSQFLQMTNDAQLLADNPDAVQMAELFQMRATLPTPAQHPGLNIVNALNNYISAQERNNPTT